jgi:hypothetical protein
MPHVQTGFLESALKQFSYYKSLGDKTFDQIPPEGLFWQVHPESNSIAVIVKHLWGNMRSRWTDFLDSDGEKPWRDREGEFGDDVNSPEKVRALWDEGWKCLFDALNPLTDNDLQKIVYIRNEGHSVVEAINRQLAHYAYHVGQIVMLGKMQRGSDWASLSIPRGGTSAYNAEKFAAPKHRAHFTDEFIDKPTGNDTDARQ